MGLEFDAFDSVALFGDCVVILIDLCAAAFAYVFFPFEVFFEDSVGDCTHNVINSKLPHQFRLLFSKN